MKGLRDLLGRRNGVEGREGGIVNVKRDWWAVPWIFAHSGQLSAIYSKLRWTKELLTDPCRLFIPREKERVRPGEIFRERQKPRIYAVPMKNSRLYRNMLQLLNIL